MTQASMDNSRIIRIFGANRDKIQEIIEKTELPSQIELTYQRATHIIYITLTAPDNTTLDIASSVIKDKLAEHIADETTETLEEAVVYFLKQKKMTLSLAESCTGGMCSARIVDVSGASEVFLGSVVSYANSAKHDLLGVHSHTLEVHGAVSAQAVKEMARGARDRFGSDIAVSVSGIAGPGGGTPEKPVGTVYFGYASSHGSIAMKASFGDIGRAKVREESVDLMLHTIIEHTISRKNG